MAGKNWQAGGKILIPAQAVVCLIATLAPFGAAWAVSDNFAPTSYVGSADPNMVWEVLIGGIVVCSFLAADRAVDPLGVAQGQAFAVAQKCICQFRPEQPQPGRGDDGSAASGSCSATIAISKSTAWRVRIFRTDMTGPELLEMRRKRGVLDISVEDFYDNAGQPGRPHHRTARRAIGPGQVFRAAERRFGGDA